MLFASGAIPRMGKVEEGNTTSDYDPEETKREISINLSPIPIPWKNNKVNLLDAPGYTDFIGGVIAGIRVADAAIVTICAASGIEVGTELMWKYAEERAIPRFIFINKMDRENANFSKVVEQVQDKFGRKCAPIQLPIGTHTSFKGVVDLINMKATDGTKDVEIDSSIKSQADSLREKLVEAIAEIDDELMMKYLEGEEVTLEEIKRVLLEGVKTGKIFPILTGSALQNVGPAYLLDAICEYLPSPKEAEEIEATNTSTKQTETIVADSGSPLAALVYMTNADPYVGKLTHFRVYSGVIESNSQVWNTNKGQIERIGQLFVFRGKGQEAVPRISAGDIGAVAKLAVTGTGDTLSVKEHPLSLASAEFPKPIYSVAIYPKTKTDVDKLGGVLTKIAEEDLTLKVEKDSDTAETILSGMGDSHVEVATERMQRKFGVGVTVETPKVPYKETVTTKVQAEYKHKKQSGGHGQYGHVWLEVEPLPRGEGFEFTERVVGGSVPKNYIPAVEKGVMEARHEGVLARFPVVDVRVTLFDGSSHPVDSSEISFKIAASQALKKGLSQGQPVLIEPIVNLQVVVPEAYIGDIIGDLNTKRAKVQGMIPDEGNQIIEAQVPLAEILRYAIDLRSMTQGRGRYTVEFSHYDEVPAYETQKITSERAQEKA